MTWFAFSTITRLQRPDHLILPDGFCENNLVEGQDAYYPLSSVMMTTLADPGATFDF